MSKHLPEDLMINIFMRLPVKSILQFTSLSKSCYSLLTHPNFISKHLNREQDDHILVRHFSRNPEKEIYTLLCDDENLDQYAQYDCPFNSSNYFFNIVGSCNGILCLNDNMSFCNVFYLWNPSIRKSVRLPNRIVWKKVDFDHKLGFGFDSVENDYKVVRISPTSSDKPPIVELYKLSTGVWKYISHVDLPRGLLFCVYPQVYLNGASHWVAFTWYEEQSAYVIVSFNMHDEIFGVIKLPNSLVIETPEDSIMSLFVSDESLCLINYNDNKTIDIWMMKEYGEAESWVKRYNISSLHIPYEPEVTYGLLKPMVTRKNGEVLWTESSGLLLSVDHENEKTKYLCVCDTTNTNYLFQVSLYVNLYKETLVLLDK